MRFIAVTVLAVTVSGLASAKEPMLLLSPVAEFSNPDVIAANVRMECNLPVYQAQAVRQELDNAEIGFRNADRGEIPPQGRHLQLRIDNAISMGNAGVGHRKQMTVSVRLFQNGAEIGKSSFTRNSRGTVLGMFQGSCAILERCANTLAKDIVGWTRMQLKSLDDGGAVNSAADTSPPKASAEGDETK